ncbi:Calcium-responsive transactivator [Schistosoma japonicum]|nr:Calcium-responsive transactivator [Schistosoma japonicum]
MSAQPGQLRREQPIQPSSIQKMLDENVRLIHSLMAHQRVGAVKEAAELERVLHRNLIYLATIADRTAAQPVVGPTSSTQPIPSGLTQSSQIEDSTPNYPISVVNASSDMPQSSVVGQPHQITVNSSIQHPLPMAVGHTTISTVGNPIVYQQYLVSSASQVTSQTHIPTGGSGQFQQHEHVMQPSELVGPISSFEPSGLKCLDCSIMLNCLD